MASPCAKCKFLIDLDRVLSDPDYPQVSYSHGCGYPMVPPPMLQIQSGRSMIWSPDDAATEEQKMLVFSNIETTTCYAFEPRNEGTTAQQEK